MFSQPLSRVDFSSKMQNSIWTAATYVQESCLSLREGTPWFCYSAILQGKIYLDSGNPPSPGIDIRVGVLPIWFRSPTLLVQESYLSGSGVLLFPTEGFTMASVGTSGTFNYSAPQAATHCIVCTCRVYSSGSDSPCWSEISRCQTSSQQL